MARSRPEVAEIIRSCGTRYRRGHGVSPAQARVLARLPLCRTAALGGHKRRCDACGHEEISYNSCRNRHCPKCQGGARAVWLEAREKELLDVAYFHVVFTLPADLGPIALQNPRVVYGLLFRAAAETLSAVARDPKHLGAEIGFLAVLHTWGQTLMLHPHLHCVVPGGGISADGARWIPCRKGFLLPVRVLSRVFRGKFLAMLGAARDRGELQFEGRLAGLETSKEWCRLLAGVRSKKWVVYAKRPFGGPVQVLKYLARYTHRVAISNHRIVSLEEDRVVFLWKDYAQGNRKRTMSLDAEEFVRRFLLHVLPKGFVRIRNFGFLANRVRKERLERIHRLLAKAGPVSGGGKGGPETRATPVWDAFLCPICEAGHLLMVEKIQPNPGKMSSPEPEDSS